jgi:hypothetical protein
MKPAFERLTAMIVVLIIVGIFSIFIGGIAALSTAETYDRVTWITVGYVLMGVGGVCLCVALLIHAIRVAAQGVVDAIRSGKRAPTPSGG